MSSPYVSGITTEQRSGSTCYETFTEAHAIFHTSESAIHFSLETGSADADQFTKCTRDSNPI